MTLERREPLKRKTPMKRGESQLKRTRLAPRSRKMNAVYNDRRKLVKDVLKEQRVCAWPGCSKRTTNVHELWTRARSGNTSHAILCRPNCVGLCDDHGGSYPHEHEAEAYAAGLIRKSHEGCPCGLGRIEVDEVPGV